ncbi:unnamed protein product [Dibothriocephalus latus]|uniref:DUF5733 domain-containing protein n=1 Tax=Dibothriocephalus latus TaxID=60516 RepID=A0A3P6T7Z1_DIBLA|nr:unnamed protein product [Dibothriocephalus latus]
MSTSESDGEQPELVTTVIGLDKNHLLDRGAFTAEQILAIIASKGGKKANAGSKNEARIYSDCIHFELTRNEMKLPDIDYENIVQFVVLPDYPDVCFILSKKRAQGQYLVFRFEKPKQIATFKRLVKRYNSRVLFEPAEPASENSDDSQRSPSPARKPIVLQKPPANHYSRPTKKSSEPTLTTTYVTNCCPKENRPPCKHKCHCGCNRRSRTQEVQTSPFLCPCSHHAKNAKANGINVGPNDVQPAKATIFVAVQTDPVCHSHHRQKSSCLKADKSPVHRKPQPIPFTQPLQPSKTTQTKPKCTCKHSERIQAGPIRRSPSFRRPCRCSKSRQPVESEIVQAEASSSFSGSSSPAPSPFSDSSSETSYKIYTAHIDRKCASQIMGEDYEWPRTHRGFDVKPYVRHPRRVGGD